MKREELTHLSSTDVWNEVVKKFGERKANSLVAEESLKIVKKHINLDKIMQIQKEASIRVLCGQINRREITLKDGMA